MNNQFSRKCDNFLNLQSLQAQNDDSFFITFLYLIAESVPIRLCVCVMIFMASFCSYMLRVNFSINVIAMAEKFNWNKRDQGLLLGAYFYGYIFPNLFGGFLAQKFGGRVVIFCTMFMSAIATAASALHVDENISFYYIFTLRLVLGIFAVSKLRVMCKNVKIMC